MKKVHREVIQAAQQRPDQRELWADDSLHVCPLMAVIPQPHLKNVKADRAGNIFDDRRTHRHSQKQHDVVQHRIRRQALIFQRGNQIEKVQAATVKRKVRPCAETGVNPLALRIGGREEPVKDQLQQPAQT